MRKIILAVLGVLLSVVGFFASKLIIDSKTQRKPRVEKVTADGLPFRSFFGDVTDPLRSARRISRMMAHVPLKHRPTPNCGWSDPSDRYTIVVGVPLFFDSG